MDILTQRHNGTLEILQLMMKNKVVASYIGPFDGNILSLLAENIKGSLWGDAKQGKRFFKIFIELAQNISLYSAEKKPTKKDSSAFGEGSLIISEYDDYFLFSAGNVVYSETAELLTSKCKKINDLDRMGQRKLKGELRYKPHEKGGGNIGLVQVALASRHKLGFRIIPIEDTDKSFYIISVRIDK